jgi:hypothetical protein
MLALFLAGLAAAQVPGGKIDVVFAKFPRAVTDGEVRAFVSRSAEPVAAYYGKFPVRQLRLEVEPGTHGPDGCFGREFGGKRIVLYLGEKTTDARLAGEHVLTHEMFHLGFPDLPRSEAWVEEGLATWLAHLARARVGQTTEQKFWSIVAEGFADALASRDGLAGTTTYRRRYWGGALFWLTIDLELRARGKTLDEVTRGILRAGGTNARKWTLERLAAAIDKIAGFPVFRAPHEEFARGPLKTSLAALWKKLGVRLEAGGGVKLEENALRAELLKNML